MHLVVSSIDFSLCLKSKIKPPPTTQTKVYATFAGPNCELLAKCTASR